MSLHSACVLCLGLCQNRRGSGEDKENKWAAKRVSEKQSNPRFSGFTVRIIREIRQNHLLTFPFCHPSSISLPPSPFYIHSDSSIPSILFPISWVTRVCSPKKLNLPLNPFPSHPSVSCSRCSSWFTHLCIVLFSPPLMILMTEQQTIFHTIVMHVLFPDRFSVILFCVLDQIFEGKLHWILSADVAHPFPIPSVISFSDFISSSPLRRAIKINHTTRVWMKIRQQKDIHPAISFQFNSSVITMIMIHRSPFESLFSTCWGNRLAASSSRSGTMLMQQWIYSCAILWSVIIRVKWIGNWMSFNEWFVRQAVIYICSCCCIRSLCSPFRCHYDPCIATIYSYRKKADWFGCERIPGPEDPMGTTHAFSDPLIGLNYLFLQHISQEPELFFKKLSTRSPPITMIIPVVWAESCVNFLSVSVVSSHGD